MQVALIVRAIDIEHHHRGQVALWPDPAPFERDLAFFLHLLELTA